MNRVHAVVWSQARRCWCAASEKTRARHKRSGSRARGCTAPLRALVALAFATGLLAPAHPQTIIPNTPTGTPYRLQEHGGTVFRLETGSTYATTSGNAIEGDASQTWSLTNNGAINARSTGVAAGVSLRGTGSGLVNNGTINTSGVPASGPSAGVHLISPGMSLVNNGQIVARDDGIHVVEA